ncbi:MAG: respiratory nitrate reductase subunit gamma, partial [Desulfobacterales bacterium]|nr:respiratory nitrate reductase subunit gamma [Desulfobacterales bacterium]
IALQIYPEEQPSWFFVLKDTFFLPTVKRHKPVLWLFLMAFHISFLLLIVGHIELIKKFTIFQIIPHEVFLGKGFIGVILAVCLLYFLFRRLFPPVKDLSIPSDYFLLILLFIVVLFGSQMDWARTWYGYEVLSIEDYNTYLQSLITLKPDVPDNATMSGHSFMLIIHVFFANIFLIYFPFSSIIHSIFAIPMNKLRRG